MDEEEKRKSLRDWFAGQALSSLLPRWLDENDDIDANDVADDAYRVADAMMIKRERKD